MNATNLRLAARSERIRAMKAKGQAAESQRKDKEQHAARKGAATAERYAIVCHLCYC